MNPAVSIIILNWNGKDDTLACLESLKSLDYDNFEITIFDNGSSDDSVEIISKAYPNVEIIESETNLGFAEGNNVAIKHALLKNPDYLLLLNNDTIVDPPFLRRLVEIGETDDAIGVLGPTIYNLDEDRTIQATGYRFNWNRGRPYPYPNKRLDSLNDEFFNELYDVDYVTGCSLLAKSRVFLDIGYLIGEYFAYWEESEWCVRAIKNGYRVVNVPDAKIWHKGMSSTSRTNGFLLYQSARNRFWFMRNHATKLQYFSFLVYFFGFDLIFIFSVALLKKRNWVGARAFLLGVLDGLRNPAPSP